MINPHPNERQLQRYLSRASTVLERKRMQQHIHSCSECRNRLHTHLNLEELLNTMPLLAPTPELEDKVMRTLRSESSANSINHDNRDKRALGAGSDSLTDIQPRRRMWRPELFNGMIATAATYVFISSGILGKIITMDTVDWGMGIKGNFLKLGQAFHELSMYFVS